MTRGELLLLLLAGAVTAALGMRAEQKATPVIGFLGSASPGRNPVIARFIRDGARPAMSRDKP